MVDSVKASNGKVAVSGVDVPKDTTSYTRIGNTLVLSTMLAGYSSGTGTQGQIILKDGARVNVNVNDHTQIGHGDAVISRDSEGNTVFSNFHQQFPEIIGTDGTDKFKILDSKNVTVNSGNGQDEVFVAYSSGTKILAHKNDGKSTGILKFDEGSSIEIFHSKKGKSSDYCAWNKGTGYRSY